MTWVVLVILLVLGGGFAAYRLGRRHAARELPPAGSATGLPELEAPGGSSTPALLERTVLDVRVDDIVQHGGRDFLVEGIVEYEEDGHRWRAARLVDGLESSWLLIGLERGAGPGLRIVSPVPGLVIDGYPPEELTCGGAPYRLSRKGIANAQVTGQTGDLPAAGSIAPGTSIRCRWWRYAGAGGRVLIVEQWGESYRVLAGDTVPAGDVELLAAS